MAREQANRTKLGVSHREVEDDRGPHVSLKKQGKGRVLRWLLLGCSRHECAVERLG
jgi:hypothetical protein